MSYPVAQEVGPHRGSPAWLVFALILIALVLAFWLGRVTASHKEEEAVADPPGANEKASKLLDDGANDKVWDDDDDASFMAALGPLSQKSRDTLLRKLSGKVNRGELKFQSHKVTQPPACVVTCPPASTPAPDGTRTPDRTK